MARTSGRATRSATGSPRTRPARRSQRRMRARCATCWFGCSDVRTRRVRAWRLDPVELTVRESAGSPPSSAAWTWRSNRAGTGRCTGTSRPSGRTCPAAAPGSASVDPGAATSSTTCAPATCWFFLQGMPHRIQALGDGRGVPARLRRRRVRRERHVLISDLFAHTAKDALAKNVGWRPAAARLEPGAADVHASPGRRPPPLGPRPGGDAPTGGRRRSLQPPAAPQKPQRLGRRSGPHRRGHPGARRPPRSAAALVEVDRAGMRELHWHRR